ncbi:MAG: HDOD domain-containing protein [Gammaproteobacteria bacterium]|nr:HDOD domain-containing protein [Gammaproteobacteria bacterium]
MQAQKIPEQKPAVFIGRQPIFNAGMELHAYELLFRSSPVNAAGQIDGNSASAHVIVNALLEIGLDDLVGNHLAFINFPYDLLTHGIAEVLPPERVVIEIVEDVTVDKNLIAGVRSLVDQGFKIALDDFIYGPEWEPLLEMADIVKLDVMGRSISEIRNTIKTLERHDLQLLAEKVESKAEYRALQKLDLEYFQGYFFSRPEVIKREKLPDNHFALLQLMSRLQDPNIDLGEVENLVSQTVSLNYKLFRYINSAHFNLVRKFDSIQQTVVYFGLTKLKNLACLIAMTELSSESSELILTGLTRAKMCEVLSDSIGCQDKDVYFMVGLFSILEALLDHPIHRVVDKLPLTEDVIMALSKLEGSLGEALRCTLSCERYYWPGMHFKNLEAETVYQAYLEAMRWSKLAASGLTIGTPENKRLK